jgi:hypothetical protein
MTLEQLRIFIAVAERQHVTQAAAQLRLTQSAVSSAISALESRHDIRLFDRVGRRHARRQLATGKSGRPRPWRGRGRRGRAYLAGMISRSPCERTAVWPAGSSLSALATPAP